MASVRRIVESNVRPRRIERREGEAIQRRISGGTDYAGFGHAEVVIEAVFEDAEIKQQVIADLERVLPATAVIASNTSALPIRDIARNAAHPERVVGMHFFSPAERMPLLEIVRPEAASADAIATAVGLGVQMGKTTIVVGDSPGFYTSRVLGVMLNEAALLLDEGAKLEAVDEAMTDFGFPVGPFVLYDEVGLEVAQHVGETVAKAFGDRFPTTSIVHALVARGETGRKAGRGFYVWQPEPRWPLVPEPRRMPNPFVLPGKPSSEPTREQIQERLVLLFVNEAVRCLDEGILASAADGDLGAVLGLGFPPFRGGPFHYADALGAKTLAAKLTALARTHGPRYAPATSLTRGEKFFQDNA